MLLKCCVFPCIRKLREKFCPSSPMSRGMLCWVIRLLLGLALCQFDLCVGFVTCEPGFYPTQGCFVSGVSGACFSPPHCPSPQTPGICVECDIGYYREERLNTNPRFIVSHNALAIDSVQQVGGVQNTGNINGEYEFQGYDERRGCHFPRYVHTTASPKVTLYVKDISGQYYNFVTNGMSTYYFFHQDGANIVQPILAKRLWDSVSMNERPASSSDWYRWAITSITVTFKTVDCTKCSLAQYNAKDHPRCIAWNPYPMGFSVSSSGSYPQQFSDAIMGPDNKIFFVPEFATYVGVLDLTTNSFIRISNGYLNPGNEKKYCKGVYVESVGAIYLIPLSVIYITVVDVFDYTMRVVSMPTWARKTHSYAGGVLGPNHKIYFMPNQASHIAVFDIANETMSKIAESELSAYAFLAFCDAVLALNGNIYFIPERRSHVLVVTPSEDNKVQAYKVPEYVFFKNGILLPNGNIVMVPETFENNFYTFSTNAHSFSVLDVSVNNKAGETDRRYMRGVLLPDGNIMLAPRFESAFIFNPANPSASSTMSIGGAPNNNNFRFQSIVLSKHGIIVFIPSYINEAVVMRNPLYCPSMSTASKTEDICVCLPGYYGTLSGECYACPTNTYKNNASLTACVSCPESRVSTATSTSVEECVCAEGYFLEPDNPIAKCEACAIGKYTISTDASVHVATMRVCHACSLYATSPGGSSSKDACVCVIGATPAISNGICIQCARGKYKAHLGASPCTLCAFGTFAAEYGSSECTPCPEGSNSSEGAVSINECMCPINIPDAKEALDPGCFLVDGTDLYYNLPNINNTGGMSPINGNRYGCQGAYATGYYHSKMLWRALKIDMTTLRFDVKDRRFASRIAGSTDLDYGVAGDCTGSSYSAKMGNFTVDLRGTPFAIEDFQLGRDGVKTQWTVDGWQSSISISCDDDGLYQHCTVFCGGGDGKCRLESGYLQLRVVDAITLSHQCIVSCTACPIHQSTDSMGRCVCSPGYYQYAPDNAQHDNTMLLNYTSLLNHNRSECTECPAGTFKTWMGNSASSCSKCPTYSYSSGTAQVRSDTCQTCPPTRYGARGSVSIEACVCDAGYFNENVFDNSTQTAHGSNESLKCTACPVGTYSGVLNSTTSQNCIVCPIHSSSPRASRSEDACECNAGFSPDSISSTCEACVPGKFKSEFANVPCLECSGGTYVETYGNTECISCPNNTYTHAAIRGGKENGSQSILDCVCNTGHEGPAGMKCFLCGAGSFKYEIGSTLCEFCPPNTYHGGWIEKDAARSCGSMGTSACVASQNGDNANGKYWGSASNAIDGRTTDGYYTMTVSSSPTELWLMVDFRYEISIHRVNVMLLVHSVTLFSITIDDKVCARDVQYLQQQPGIGKSIVETFQAVVCDNGRSVTGRYLKISISNTRVLAVYELRAWSRSCMYCPEGTTNYNVQVTSIDQCGSICPASGTYFGCVCPVDTSGPRGGPCVPCPSDSVLPQGQNTQYCLCNAGLWRNETADVQIVSGDSAESCMECAAGKYKTGPGNFACTDCGVDTFSSSIAAMSPTTCKPCPAHSKSSKGCSSLLHCCTCINGYAQKVTDNTTCVMCGEDTFSQRVRPWNISSVCTQCPPDTTSLAGSSACLCKAGLWRNEPSRSQIEASESTSCIACSAGKYKTGPGDLLCTDCGIDTFSTSIGAMSPTVCRQCPLHSQSPQGCTSLLHCCTCNDGYAQGIVDNTTCILCAANTFSQSVHHSNVSTFCARCPQNSTSSSGSSACQCSAGFEQDNENNQNRDPQNIQCNACRRGKQKEGIGPGPCICIDGYGQYPIENNTCALCAQNTFSQRMHPWNVSSSCVRCPENTTSPPGSSGSSACQCIADFEQEYDNNYPRSSQDNNQNRDAQNSQCNACSRGKQKEGIGPGPCICIDGYGQYPIENTTCALCAENTFSQRMYPWNVSSSCVRCPENSTSPPGSSGSSACQCIAGFEQEYDNNYPHSSQDTHQCTPCMRGQQNGDIGGPGACTECEYGKSTYQSGNSEQTFAQCFPCGDDSIRDDTNIPCRAINIASTDRFMFNKLIHAQPVRDFLQNIRIGNWSAGDRVNIYHSNSTTRTNTLNPSVLRYTGSISQNTWSPQNTAPSHDNQTVYTMISAKLMGVFNVWYSVIQEIIPV